MGYSVSFLLLNRNKLISRGHWSTLRTSFWNVVENFLVWSWFKWRKKPLVSDSYQYKVLYVQEVVTHLIDLYLYSYLSYYIKWITISWTYSIWPGSTTLVQRHLIFLPRSDQKERLICSTMYVANFSYIFSKEYE